MICRGPGSTIRPSLGPRANAASAGSISVGARRVIGLISTANDGATDWIAPSIPNPVGELESKSTATRAVRGAISLSSSNHFALIPNSKRVSPVALPPGRARLATKQDPTGSVTGTNTTGMLRVAASNGAVTEDPTARITSGASATISAA